jgi:hypothetical protein
VNAEGDFELFSSHDAAVVTEGGAYRLASADKVWPVVANLGTFPGTVFFQVF